MPCSLYSWLCYRLEGSEGDSCGTEADTFLYRTFANHVLQVAANGRETDPRLLCNLAGGEHGLIASQYLLNASKNGRFHLFFEHRCIGNATGLQLILG